MNLFPLQERNITNSRIIYGTTGLGGSNNFDPLTGTDLLKAERAVDAALEAGMTMFDHADIYTGGKAEEIFGSVLQSRPGLRESIVIQSKCGIRFADEDGPQRYDFSKAHILRSVDGSLSRLKTDYLDILLLHRPDPLARPDEIAEAFDRLKRSGKVRHFGVSNMNVHQIRLLQRALPEPLVANQMEMSLLRSDFADRGVYVNQQAGLGVVFPEGLLEHCMLENIQLQAWSSLANGIYTGRSKEGASEAVIRTSELVSSLAERKETTGEAIVLGWLMKHPANIQPVIGTANPERILRCRDAARQAELMTREEWYALYAAAKGRSVT
ncbi:aldo/keto reductase [Paenibacillus sp. MWE-103]|uniref:Aldo/keto reductase n=1 Tax=Paenibacillus artemisiicola TaxID=1172618 RepID=A0ABS3W5S6_9BACL|nr:aldo/keto reductase [Paenibacillus artemisiicola]MBO7743531.1 aldo/keto reductase [Paenibacillus artemisiicola]